MHFKKIKSIKFLAKLFLFCFIFVFSFFVINFIYATDAVPGILNQRGSVYGSAGDNAFEKVSGQIPVTEAELQQISANIQQITGTEFSFLQGVETKKTLSSKLFQTTLSTALNSLAFDAANWIASGGKGQGAAFERRGLGQIALDAVDSAAGDFLYTLGQEGITGVGGLNLCQPSLGLDIRIGLGLQQFKRPEPKCTFSEMRENWEQEMRDPNFLKNFQDYFEPTSNDLGIALNIQTANLERLFFEKENAVETAKTSEISAGGIKPISEMISGLKTTPAKFIYDAKKNQLIETLGNNIGKYTGDALIDALNIFINQLAIQLIQKLLQGGLFQGDSGSGSGSGSGLYNPYTDTASGGGVQAAKDRFREIIQPRFNVRGDYDILAELAMCPDQNPGKAGPTNCVITDNFRRAIQERKTVGQAMDEGLLTANGTFGFSGTDEEPNYENETYPYRSIIILRKFRIVPVGWEIAASKINKDFGTVGQTTLSDMVACFNACDNYKGLGDGTITDGKCQDNDNSKWCRSLVDPNWVLKAPLNYCARSGYGEELLGEVRYNNDGAQVIQRQDDYCADEQTCIKEGSDGSCEVYGYCTEDRRTWNFGADSCNPLYNTCRTFYGEDRQSTSYLENTLEWCDASGAGCKWYSTKYNYPALNMSSSETWSSLEVDRTHFNKNVEQCDSNAEGCTELIRTKAGLGTNLIPNSSFEEYNGSSGFTGWEASANAEVNQISAEITGLGSYSIKIIAKDASNLYVSRKIIEDSEGTSLFKGHRYILSGLIKPTLSAGKAYLSVGEVSTSLITSASNGVWQGINVSFEAPEDIVNAEVRIVVNTPTVGDVIIADALQLEEVTNSNTPSAYKNYRDANVIYEKLLPNYLITSGKLFEGFCFDANGGYKSDAPNECFNYARRCTVSEANCELYTRVWDGFAVPAKVTPDDYCPEVCAGYDLHIQKETVFESTQGKYLIPANAKTCNAQAAGCDQFTNLDEVELGGEGIEYYSALRQCTIISSDSAPFYVWEGSEDSGFQLRVFTLEKSSTNANIPVVTNGVINTNNNHAINEIEVCNESIFNAEANNTNYNSDCRQFYSRSGVITYALFSQTISYDTNCHPYRRSDVNIDPDLNTSTSCSASGSGYANTKNNQFHWDAGNSACYFCKNNGVWNEDMKACVYMAIPQQGQVCSATENGCRQYVGNVGNNVRNIVVDDFENGSLNGWGSFDTSSNFITLPYVDIAKESIRVGGSSLYAYDGNLEGVIKAYKKVEENFSKEKNYLIEFLVKTKNPRNVGVSGQPNSMKIALYSPSLNKEHFIAWVQTSNEWDLKSVKLDDFGDYNIQGDEMILFEQTDLDASGGVHDNPFYIDYIILREAADNYYLIKDLWNTPTVCDQDWKGNTDIHYMAGCYEYQDRDENSHFLKSFSGICSESAVGCELMINTKDSTSDQEEKYLDETVTVEADSLAYVVYNPNVLCGVSDKGCERFGEPALSQNQVTSFNDIYLKDNSDKYGEILCGAEDIGCSEYRDNNNSYYYFKDPKNQTCDYRDGYYGFNWYKQKTKKCDDGTGSSSNGGSATAGNNNIEHHYNNSYFGDLNNGQPLENNICLSNNDCSIVDGMGSIECNSDAECGPGNACVDNKCRYSCIIDDWDDLCPTDADIAPKTIGYGGNNNRILQPKFKDGQNWVGLCPAYESSCAEIIDPVSKPAVNLLFNSDFSGDVDVDGHPDGWSITSPYKQEVILTRNTLYRLAVMDASVDITKKQISVNCDQNIYFLNPETNKLVDTDEVTTNQSILFYSKDNRNCEVSVNVNSDIKVELKEAIISYNLSSGLDLGACNGVYNYSEGCVLFNLRAVEGKSYQNLIYDADPLEINLTAKTQNLPDCKDNPAWCDSSQIIQAQHNRVCDEWLACRSKASLRRADDQVETVCTSIDVCDGLDENNQCKSWVFSDKENQTIGVLNNTYGLALGEIANMTGYSKVGFYSSDTGVNSKQTTEGMLPLGKMRQQGSLVDIPNGNFEVMGLDGFPLGWSVYDATGSIDWDSNASIIINNKNSADNEPVNYPMEGKNFLRIGSTFKVVSEPIEIINDVSIEYILSAYLNTVNLSTGKAVVKIEYLNSENKVARTETLISQVGRGSDIWEFYLKEFHVPVDIASQIRSIKITLEAEGSKDGSSEIGSYYFDDLQIRPALQVRDVNPSLDSNTDYWVLPQSCRLYPRSNSLSCDYVDSNNMIQKGWRGYCLEYDRGPEVGATGNSNNCILWWPVERVQGDMVDEYAGYKGRYPLYYCTEFRSMILVEYREGKKTDYTGRGDSSAQKICNGYGCFTATGGSECNIFNDGDGKWCPNGYCTIHQDYDKGLSGSRDDYGCSPPPDGCYAECEGPITEGHIDIYKGWYEYDGDLQNYSSSLDGYDETIRELRFYDPVTNTLYGLNEAPFCTKVVGTVSPAGQNKYWAGRVYTGSNYNLLNDDGPLQYGYTRGYEPFGAIVPPDPVQNPYEWDGLSREGRQPVAITTSNDYKDYLTYANAGSPYACTGVNCGKWGICNISKNICYDALVDSGAISPADHKFLCDAGETCIMNFNSTAYNGVFPNFNATNSVTGENLVESEIKRIFAKSYGSWHWDDTTARYEEGDGIVTNWNVPINLCNGTGVGPRPAYPNDYCLVKPKVLGVNSDSYQFNGSGFINLTFYTEVDDNQEPIVSIHVDWGDNEVIILSGVELRDRPSGAENPHSFYHLYEYWDMKNKDGQSNLISCSTDTANERDYCDVNVKIKIKDNWGTNSEEVASKKIRVYED